MSAVERCDRLGISIDCNSYRRLGRPHRIRIPPHRLLVGRNRQGHFRLSKRSLAQSINSAKNQALVASWVAHVSDTLARCCEYFCSPRSAFRRVDFPTFDLPTSASSGKCPSGGGICSCMVRQGQHKAGKSRRTAAAGSIAYKPGTPIRHCSKAKPGTLAPFCFSEETTVTLLLSEPNHKLNHTRYYV